MGLTFKEMQDELIGRLKSDHSANDVIRVRCKQWINLARDQFVGYGPWYFLMKTATVPITNTIQNYSLAADFDRINDQEVFLTGSSVRMYPIDDDDLMLVLSDLAAAGTPVYFRMTGYQNLKVFPIPNADAVSAEGSITYTYFYRLTTALSGDGDVTGLPEYTDPIVIDLAESFAQSFNDNPAKRQAAFQQAMSAIQKLWQDNSEILRIHPRDIPPALRIGEFEQTTQVDRS